MAKNPLMSIKSYGVHSQLLHSWRLYFPKTADKELLSDITGKEFIAPVPAFFKTVMEREGISYGNLEFQRT